MGTALGIGIQCLEALEHLHSVCYLHRDVKPANFTIGRKDTNELRRVYVLDFGMVFLVHFLFYINRFLGEMLCSSRWNN